MWQFLWMFSEIIGHVKDFETLSGDFSSMNTKGRGRATKKTSFRDKCFKSEKSWSDKMCKNTSVIFNYLLNIYYFILFWFNFSFSFILSSTKPLSGGRVKLNFVLVWHIKRNQINQSSRKSVFLILKPQSRTSNVWAYQYCGSKILFNFILGGFYCPLMWQDSERET